MVGDARHVHHRARPFGRAQHEVVLGGGAETVAQAAELHDEGTSDRRETADVVAAEDEIRGPGGLEARREALAGRVDPVLVGVDDVGLGRSRASASATTSRAPEASSSRAATRATNSPLAAANAALTASVVGPVDGGHDADAPVDARAASRGSPPTTRPGRCRR